MDDAIIPGDGDESELVFDAGMAGLILGPILTSGPQRDAIRDGIASALESKGITAVALTREQDGEGVYTHLTPQQVGEAFISALADAFGFSVPGYYAVPDATLN